MFEWLEESLSHPHKISVASVALDLAIAFAFGCAVASVYFLTQRKPRSESASIMTTLVLLTILIAMVTLVIGNSVARAFSLVGALAIVRFRTVVEDTRDTAFVIFAVIVGMAAGIGGNFLCVPLVGIPIVAVASFLMSLWGHSGRSDAGDFSLNLRVGLGQDPESVVREPFRRHLTLIRLRSTTTARQGSALDLTYHIRMRREGDAVAFVAELNRIEGVQNVELHRL